MIWHLPCCWTGDRNLFLDYMIKKLYLNIYPHMISTSFVPSVINVASYYLSSMKHRPQYFLWWKATFAADSSYLHIQLSPQRIRNFKNRVKITLVLKNEQKCLNVHKFAKITLQSFKMFNKWKSIVGNNYFKKQKFPGLPNNNS